MHVPPLRKRTSNGVLYTRPAEVEKLIVETLSLPFEEFLERAEISTRKHSKYLPSEVLVHRIRATRHSKTDEQFNALYTVLKDRIYRSCPNVSAHGRGKGGTVGKLLDVREDVLEQFSELLLKDREGYAEKMDFFEIRFDRRVYLMKKSAFRTVERREKPLISLDDDEGDEISRDVEAQLWLKHHQSMTPDEELTYLFQIRRAIDLLPEKERRVIDMLLAMVPIESKNPDKTSIVDVLGCTPKTVRNRRDRGVRRIREMLELEDSDAD